MEQAELLALLDAGDFEAVLGVPETDSIDFKRSPYRIDEQAEAFELAKDVTALANTPGGGVLVVGFQTRAREESGVDTVESVHLFSRASFSRDQWIAKAQQLVFPSIVGLDARFKPSIRDQERGVAVILVPAQADHARYFLVAKEFVSADGAPGWMVGLSVRSADRNRSLAIGEIHALISRSLHLGVDIDEIKVLLREVHAQGGQAEAPAAPDDALEERVARARRELGEV
ncbi:MAG TPA: RNA-binding domain-containing protein [Gaiellaceae bacterium]|nr:RNA-binding domain-containing protein [Gaiellaceae bacterium]